jgi:hypothetical protein
MDMNEFVTTAGFALFGKTFFLSFFFFFFVKIKILTNNLKHKILRINTGTIFLKNAIDSKPKKTQGNRCFPYHYLNNNARIHSKY